jgi:DNA repair protein RecN (Recombination protein N)
MIRHLFIRNFAIVECLELELGPGLTVLTGETGAGKSILLDALGLALGDRGTPGVIRPGAEAADITVSFDVSTLPAVQDWLRDQALLDDDDATVCQVRRVIQAGGRSRSYINGRPTALQPLRLLGEQLLDIHGQHAHQSLLRRDVQRALLDHHAGNQPLLAAIAGLHARLRGVDEALERLGGDPLARDARRDLLGFQLQELEALPLEPAAIAAIDAEHRRLSNAGALIETSQRLLALLHDEDGAARSLLGQAQRALATHLDDEPVFREVDELLDAASAHVGEAVDTLRHHLDRLDVDPQRLAALDETLAALSALSRKHRVRPEALQAVYQALREEAEELDGQEGRVGALREERRHLLNEYDALADTLSRQRQTAAAGLATQVTEALQGLGMQRAAFRIAVAPEPDRQAGAYGRDQVSFEVRSNPGQPFATLQRVASGGELSRISLAIQVIAADGATVPSLIFDEADVGIGGGVAEVVGKQLRALGRSHQVLCVTHLPQVASQGHVHLRVSKRSDGEHTSALVEPLDPAGRLEEIARMLGGLELTEATRQHAADMLRRAESDAR